VTEEQLLEQLRRWGAFKTLAKLRRQEVAPNPRQHIIDRVRRFAPLTSKRAKKTLLGRGGEARRRIVAAKAGVKGLYMVPKWSCDPIRCKQTNAGGGLIADEQLVEMPVDLQWIDRALQALQQSAPILALIVRFEFTFDGTQRERAEAAQKRYGGELTYWQYRRELESALAMMRGFAMGQGKAA
jgi:hypothetical protein